MITIQRRQRYSGDYIKHLKLWLAFRWFVIIFFKLDIVRGKTVSLIPMWLVLTFVQCRVYQKLRKKLTGALVLLESVMQYVGKLLHQMILWGRWLPKFLQVWQMWIVSPFVPLVLYIALAFFVSWTWTKKFKIPKSLCILEVYQYGNATVPLTSCPASSSTTPHFELLRENRLG